MDTKGSKRKMSGFLIIGTIVLISFVMYRVIEHIQDTEHEKIYKIEHALKVEQINKEKLAELLMDCKKNGINPEKRPCDCRCQYSSIEPGCCCSDEHGEDTTDPEKCFPVFGCGDGYCSVFNTMVEHISGCVWCEQDRLYEQLNPQRACLLSKCSTNEKLKILVDELLAEE